LKPIPNGERAREHGVFGAGPAKLETA